MVMCSGAHQPFHAAELAVVIDDVGYNKARGLRAVNLPGPVTIAVLPFAPHTGKLAQRAADRGHDVIVHQPMEGRPSPNNLEEHGTLKLHMHAHDFDSALNAALEAIPQRVGLSNHTGSLLTAHHDPMRRVMAQLRSRDLFFLDSRTTADTVAHAVARELGVPALRRDVFLDHDPRPEAIQAAFQKALRIARRKGHAVIIGHPYGNSLDYLEARLANMPEDISLVSAGELVRQTAPISHPVVLARQPGPTSPHISLGR